MSCNYIGLNGDCRSIWCGQVMNLYIFQFYQYWHQIHCTDDRPPITWKFQVACENNHKKTV